MQPNSSKNRTIWIPPRRPLVIPRAFRASMNEHHSRPLALGSTFESGWSNHEPMGILPLSRAFEPEVLPGREGFALQPFGGEGRKARNRRLVRLRLCTC